MKQSLKNAGEETPANPTVVDEAALDAIEGGSETSIALRGSTMPEIGTVSGSLTSSDLVIPRLQLVQAVGDLSNKYGFIPGSYILNKDLKLSDGTEPLSVTVLAIVKSYEENIPFVANGPIPRRFRNLDEVSAAGLHCNWVKGNPPPPAREVADATLMIEKPASMDGTRFGFTIEGRAFTLALWTLRSTAYSRAAKTIFSAAAMDLKQTGLISGVFSLTSRKEQLKGNWISLPDIRLVSRHSPAFMQSIKSALQ